MTDLNDIRHSFLDFFAEADHTIVPSSPLVPLNDPSLMFTNSGMVQFKNIFTGQEASNIKRASTSQKCIRAGGKHNDLDNVGYTARHHTFFEMLGNFSFGDYFKEKAIYYAWNYLTTRLELPKEKLCVTIYHDDDEAFDLWKKIAGFSDDKIIRISTNDNFWSMGDTGPCGPCSEIFYDHGPSVFGGPPGSADQDGDRFIEIWNLVFMQYEQLASGERIKLPKPSIDTGMGLERVAAVAQHVHNNYDIDLFKNIINFTSDAAKVKVTDENMVSFRVIADHIRSTSFLMADGVLPANEGRGYVLRRIMRRGMRHAHQLGCKEPLFYKLIPGLIHEMGDAYPELVRAKDIITQTLKIEEEKFKETLDRGLKLLAQESATLGSGDVFSGEVAFKLYDTYGFPLDLTSDILKSKNIKLDEAGFNESMDKQKAAAKAAWAGSGSKAVADIWFNLQNKFGGTEFLGYEFESAEANVLAIISGEDELDAIKPSENQVMVLLNQTPFYGESGGQMGDIGKLTANGLVFEVVDTKKFLGNLHIHIGYVRSGELKKNMGVNASIDGKYRRNLRAHHSATHILHAVLKNILGGHVTQKGSLVAHDKLRFDISHHAQVTKEELAKTELAVNNFILQNFALKTELMPTDKAIEEGAMALFGEKYDQEVRVVSMGTKGEFDYSKELCGGTHVARTGDIGLFIITSESSVASGVRRIEAVVGENAYKLVRERQNIIDELTGRAKVLPNDLVAKFESFMDENKELSKELQKLKKQMSVSSSNTSVTKVGDIDIMHIACSDISAKELRDIAMEKQSQLKSSVIIVTLSEEGKLSVVIAITKDIESKANAAELIKASENIIGGSGGGKPNLAQAGGTGVGREKELVALIEGKLK